MTNARRIPRAWISTGEVLHTRSVQTLRSREENDPRPNVSTAARIAAFTLALVGATGCESASGDAVFDLSKPLPPFVSVHYVSPDEIARISRFRSSAGHDHSDGFETCRSMKHYLVFTGADWSRVQIRSPVAGTIVEREDSSVGGRLVIRSQVQPAFSLEIFHVVPAASLTVGARVEAGQVLGHHIGIDELSDIAVSVMATDDGGVPGRRLVSYFDVMTDEAFAAYQARGVGSRADLVITAAERDASPLVCDAGGTFVGTDVLSSWVALTP